MAERTSYAPGTFSFADLSTSDPGAAKAFYGALFGWEAEDVQAGGAGTYTLLRRDGRLVAGLSERPGPASWLAYVTVADAAATVARARELGASVLAEPFDVPGAGRTATIADPQGAALAVWQPAGRAGAELVNAHGALSWTDLVTPGPEDAAAFYAGLFGWEATQIPDQPYWTIATGGRSQGGLMRQPPPMAGAPAFWTAYFGVDDLEAALATARGAGGEVVNGPMEVPAGRFAALRDPQGAVFSLVEGAFDD